MSPSPSHYPKRPSFFACRYIRLLTKKCVANELGPQAFTLLTVIAMTEDARGYTDAVTFYNGQLFPLIGVGSEDALDRVRKKCVQAGWLRYVPGGRRLGPGRYWVTIPERYAGTDDAPTDEPTADAGLLRTSAGQTAELDTGDTSLVRTGAEQTASKPRANREQTAEPSSLSPSPIPEPPSEVCSEPPQPAASEPAILTAPTTGKGPKEWHLTAAKLTEYEKSYPTLDVLAALRAAIQWCRDNPTKRKTARGMPAFCTRWLNNAVNRGEHPKGASSPTAPAPQGRVEFGRQPPRTQS